MHVPLDALRERFANPPMSDRHLVIVHSFHHPHHSTQPGQAANSEESEDAGGRIARKLARIAEWGFGGVVANVGSANYLEDEQEWGHFLTGFQAAKSLGMRFWIYDEDGYPSGAAGGIVLRDHPEYEAKSLARMRERFPAGAVRMRPPTGWLYTVRVEADVEGSEGTVDITSALDAEGFVNFSSSAPCVITRFDVRRAFEGTHCTCNVYRARRYINVLSRDAVNCFYDVTEGRYFDRLGDDASYVEAIFTDEPSFMSAYHVPLNEEWRQRVPVQDPFEEQFDQIPMIAWDDDTLERFKQRWGWDLRPELGRLFEGNSPRDLRVRHDFYQLQSEIYADTFFGLQQSRLNQKGIAFSGHVLCEESLTMHIACEGNVMSNLEHMQIPGIDMLSSIPEHMLDTIRLLTCKYGSSAAHVMGREQVMSESSEFEQRIIGSDTTLAQRRAAFALQMAMGITTLTSYYQWHQCDPGERRQTLDFWARLAVVVRSGTHIADFAVLYPVRTGWAWYKPVDKVLSPEHMDEPLRSMDEHLLQTARTLLRNGLDFDFIDTRDLISAGVDAGKLRIANEAYGTLVIPRGAVMCPQDLRAMERFVESGGRVIAFEPCSDFALPEIASPPNGSDTGPGASPADVIARLRDRAPDRVVCVDIGSDWLAYAQAAASRDVRLTLHGDYLIARRSVHEHTDIILLVNGAVEDASAHIELEHGRTIELWDPWTGKAASVDSSSADIAVPARGAMIAVSRRSA